MIILSQLTFEVTVYVLKEHDKLNKAKAATEKTSAGFFLDHQTQQTVQRSRTNCQAGPKTKNKGYVPLPYNGRACK